jgi:hypothetical protein
MTEASYNLLLTIGFKYHKIILNFHILIQFINITCRFILQLKIYLLLERKVNQRYTDSSRSYGKGSSVQLIFS